MPYCIPALVLGLVLRVILTIQLPYAFFHDDTPDFLTTPDRLLNQHKWEVHQKKTFLTPIVFTLPFLVKAPALIAIPIAQHVLGLLMIVIVGMLCRLWFVHWKWFIVPLTILTAANPFLLWYEHTLMAETIFAFCMLLVALSGTLYALAPTRRRFIFLCVTLVLISGARPEGKLLFGFGLLLLLRVFPRLHGSAVPDATAASPALEFPQEKTAAKPKRSDEERKIRWVRIGALAALALLVHLATKTSQAGLLLYTSVAIMTPTELRCAPGFDPYIAPIRADLQQRWSERPNFPRVRDRRAVSAAVKRYLQENHVRAKVEKHRDVNAFCLKLALETCVRNFFQLPEHVIHKFRFVATETPAGMLDNHWVFEKQREAFVDQTPIVLRLAKPLTGQQLTTEAEVNAFVDRHYWVVPWFNTLSDRWLQVVNSIRFRDTIFPDPARQRAPFVYFGVPLYFFLGALGLVAVALWRGPLQAFHFAWALALVGFFYVIMLTANVRPRFRFVFEPFWFIYIALLLESVWLSLRALRRR